MKKKWRENTSRCSHSAWITESWRVLDWSNPGLVSYLDRSVCHPRRDKPNKKQRHSSSYQFDWHVFKLLGTISGECNKIWLRRWPDKPWIFILFPFSGEACDRQNINRSCLMSLGVVASSIVTHPFSSECCWQLSLHYHTNWTCRRLLKLDLKMAHRDQVMLIVR